MRKIFIRNSVLFLLLVFCFNVLVPMSVMGLNIKYGYFPDVADTHWAKQVITKMNLRNVVSGYEENGVRNFKPDNPVTQLEAVIMALRTKFNLAEKEAFVDTNRTLSFDVDPWAKAAMLVGVDEGLIVGSNFQPGQEATRAWVAQLLVRMLGKENEINSVSGDVLYYSDAYAIPTEYLNYVKVADNYGLIKGSVNNNFLPNNSVTRAEMVAFLSRTEQYVDIQAANVIIGTIKGINGSNITVRSDEGTEYTLICNISSNLYGSNAQEIWNTDLRVNDRVYTIVDGNMIQYLDLNPPQAKITTTTVTGSVILVYPDENTIVIKNEEDKLETIPLLATTEIVKENTQGTLTLADLTKDLEVNITYNSQGQPLQVTILSNVSSPTGGEGIVFDISTQYKLLTLKNASGLAVYYYTEDTEVEVGSKRLATIDDIRVGDKILVEGEEGILTKITLIQSEVDFSAEGKVKQLSTADRILTFETGSGELKALYVDINAQIDFSGETGALADILVGDTVQVNIEDGKVTQLSITSRKLHDRYKGTVVGTDYTNRVITVKDSDNILHAYEVSSSVEIVLNDDDAYLHEIKKDMRVEMELTDEKITYLAAKDTLLGTVVRVSDSSNIIELKLDTGETKTYSLDSSVDIDIEDENRVDVDDIRKDDVVEIKIEDNEVTDIRVQRVLTYEIVETYSSSSSRIKVVDRYDDDKSLYIYSGVELSIPGITYPKVADLKVNDVVKATYLGYNLQKVEAAPVMIGNVSFVNAATSTASIKSYDGRTFDLQFTASDRIIKNNTTYTNFTYLSVGDRLAVEENLDGGKVYNIMNKASGKLGALYKDKTVIYLQITQTNWQKYEMEPSAYLHQGAIGLTTSDFKLNDQVDIYLANSKVYEVEKK
ncbi:MAG: S-layer homology domain-containing protein [Peptococcaceae bacterium]